MRVAYRQALRGIERRKFGNDPAKHLDFSAVTLVAKDKGIPPFFILYVAGHPDTGAQAQRLGNVLKNADLPVTLFGTRETTHGKINATLPKGREEVTLDEAVELLAARAGKAAPAPKGKASAKAAPAAEAEKAPAKAKKKAVAAKAPASATAKPKKKAAGGA